MTRAANQAWVWVTQDILLAVHDEQIAEHGGGTGLRDAGLLASAIARPQHLVVYGEPDAAQLAAAYAFGVARNHPFVDGNKRTAYVAAELFLALNGIALTADDAGVTLTMLQLAAGDMSEEAYAGWLRQHLQAL
ncbi:MAG: type II toxin-antitoxin system death-on-curing family toxin [Proteobacteria bacterium]|nr:type II toxin-antitoxin system death-on-curing family toxin [Pseudomonadota bacterium]